VDQKGKLSDVPYDKYTGRILEEVSRRKTPRDPQKINKQTGNFLFCTETSRGRSLVTTPTTVRSNLDLDSVVAVLFSTVCDVQRHRATAVCKRCASGATVRPTTVQLSCALGEAFQIWDRRRRRGFDAINPSTVQHSERGRQRDEDALLIKTNPLLVSA
jgi:hypothetical protein